MDAIKYVQDLYATKNTHPEFRPGDNVVVNYKIVVD